VSLNIEPRIIDLAHFGEAFDRLAGGALGTEGTGWAEVDKQGLVPKFS